MDHHACMDEVIFRSIMKENDIVCTVPRALLVTASV